MDEMPDREAGTEGVSRRDFIKTVSVASVVAPQVGTPHGAIAATEPDTDQVPTQNIALKVNGGVQRLEVEPRWTLAFVLRERLGLTGSKVGCDRGMCGMCTVIVNGNAVYSCNTLAVLANGKEIQTIEGLSDGYDYDDLHPLQKAFVDKMAFQCAYCTSAQILTAKTLLDQTTKLTLEDVKWNQRGVLCRCGCYPKIFKAVLHAAQVAAYRDPEKVGV